MKSFRARSKYAATAELELLRLHEAIGPELLDWLRAHYRRRLQDRLELEDVEQEVWLHAARAWPQFDPRRGTLRRWLQRIARRTVLDLLRAARAQSRELDSARAQVVRAEPRESLATELARQELLQRLEHELANLSRVDRELLLVCGIEGRPSTAAARTLAISGAAARKRWLRLRQRLSRRTDLAGLVS